MQCAQLSIWSQKTGYSKLGRGDNLKYVIPGDLIAFHDIKQSK